MKTNNNTFINSKQKVMSKTQQTLTALLLAGGTLMAQNNYIPGLSPSPGNIGINLPSAPTEFNLQVRGSIGMNYGFPFGVTNTGWPTNQTRILIPTWDATSFDHVQFYTPGAGAGSATEKMRLTVYGNLGVGTTNPIARIEAEQVANPSGVATAGSYFALGASQSNIGVRAQASNGNYNIAGQFVTSGGSTQNIGVMISNNASGIPANDWAIYALGRTWCTLGVWTGSDRKIKDNIKPMENMMDKIKLLKPSTYTFRTDEFKGLNLPQGEQIGLIAQEVEQVFPGMVSESKGVNQKNERGEITIETPDLKSVNYTNLVPVLIKGMQEQQAHIEQQDKRADEQNKTIGDLKNLVAMQQQQIADLLGRTGNATGLTTAANGIDGFSMDQNIPNPFNNETVISYNLPQHYSKANMVVYDLSGKQISSFPLTQKGKSSITINSDKLAAGIYIYSIIADGKVMDSKRMVVSAKD